MSRARVVKSKKAGLSDVGKQLANMKDDFDMAFDRIKEITFMASGHPQWKQEAGVLMYRKLVAATLRNKDIHKKKQFIQNFCRPWRKMYDQFRDSILGDDLGFLTKNTIVMTTGKSKSAQLPLSAMYLHFLKSDEDKLATLEAHMFFMFMRLQDEKTEKEDRAALQEICSQYELEEDEASKSAISSIVKTVKGSMANLNGEKPDVNNILPIVQAVLGNEDMQNNMHALATGLISGQTGIPDLVASVKQTVEADQAAAANNEEVPELEGGESDEMLE